MKLWLGVFGAIFVVGIIAYWLVSHPLREMIAVSNKKKNKAEAK